MAEWSLADSFGLFNFNANNNATFVGGGQVGANYQFGGNFVVGIEGDFDWFANNNNSVTVTGPLGTTFQGGNNGRWLTTLTGRLGYAYDRVLFYGKGGGAWVGSNNFTLTSTATGASASFSNNNTNTGWTAGGGVEWAFTNNWTARVEYDYVGLSNQTFVVPAGVRCRHGGRSHHQQSQHPDGDGRRQLPVQLGCRRVLTGDAFRYPF